MSKSERIKAQISFYEKMFFSALAIALTVIGWAANNYAQIDWRLLTGAGIALFITFIFGIWSYRQIKRLMEELEDA